MAAAGKLGLVLGLVLGLLASAHCEVRARDPEVKEEVPGRGVKPHPAPTEAPPLGERARPGHKLDAHKQKIFTVVHWACCKGHGGDPEAAGSDAQLDLDLGVSGGSDPEKPELRAPDVHAWPQQRDDLTREQNDHHASQAYDTSSWTRKPEQPVADEVDVISYPEATAALPVPHMMALVMSQLQPVLEGFNRSLERLSRQLGDLARDVAVLKSSRDEMDLELRPLDEAAEQRFDTKLEEAFQQITDIRTQIESRQTDVENRLRSQNAMLHYNVTTFKMDVDLKLQRHQKMWQVSLQAMNTTLDRYPLEDHDPPPSPPQLRRLSDSSALWEAIERLDSVVVNNTVQVSGLMEDADATSGSVQRLETDLKKLREQMQQTGRKAQIQYMMTGLEVDAAKVTVLRRVDELAANLTLQDKRLQEMDVDMDYLYTVLYKNSSSDCGALKASVARLEQDVANAMELANDNRLALHENNKAEEAQWSRASPVEALKLGLQQVNDTLVSEQSCTRSLNHSLTQLSGSVTVSLAEVSGLKDTNRQLWEETQKLSGSFNALLRDASRHSDVLELLLGEEVLEFMEWPKQDQEAHSIPALKQQLSEHNLRIASLANGAGAREEQPSADQPSSSHRPLPGAVTRSSGSGPARERQLLLHPEQAGAGSDLMEEDISTESVATLQAEVLWLKRGLERHLSVFKNVFGNADVLTRSNHTLELDRLWELVKNKDGRKDKKRGGRGNRSRRKSADVPPAPAGPSDVAVQFVARSPQSVSHSGIAFKPSVNQGRFCQQTGSFTAPVGGAYLFILTLDLRPGPVHVVLRRRSGGSVSLHHAGALEAGPRTGVSLLLLRGGEEVRLERRRGAWRENQDNVFTGLLLHRTT